MGESFGAGSVAQPVSQIGDVDVGFERLIQQSYD